MAVLPELKKGTEQIIEDFLTAEMRKSGAKGFIVGVSGGIDSAVVMKLSARAVGKDKVHAVLMPERDSSKEDLEDAKGLCTAEGVEHSLVDITPAVEAFSKILGGKVERASLANIKARCRMVALYHFANTERRLVAGTSNKSEMLTGYFTKFGDGGADVEPIADLYKTQVWALAKELGIPEKIIEKAPSAGLWKGQTDEGELGITYEHLDAILFGMEQGKSGDEVSKLAGVPVKEVRRIAELVRRTTHKRRMAPAPKLEKRTPGQDWPEPG